MEGIVCVRGSRVLFALHICILTAAQSAVKLPFYPDRLTNSVSVRRVVSHNRPFLLLFCPLSPVWLQCAGLEIKTYFTHDLY